MGGRDVLGGWVRVVVNVVCCIGACARVVLWGDSGGLGESESSLM